MTKKEFLNLPAFQKASDDAEVWIQTPGIDDLIPTDAWMLPFADGRQNLIIKTVEPEDPWQRARIAARTLNKMDLGIKFYGNLFPYLRKRGKLEGYCMKGTIGKKQPVWLYDTEGIAFLVKNGMLNYSPKN